MVQFSKLRLTGFKSFPDATEIDIMPGLNGIVGPNGCGKSNLVEAMRWLMGETSAKSLRGGEMDDVIFAGTDKRPSRNFAEVILTLKNPDKSAPEPYRDMDTIEVSRRIDRGMGSDYRINGKAVRAADVQLLFADSSTGAHSPAIVSQGRVTALIQAKPVDRRRVLEDAAGISGLHNRRREAEIKLRAAEKNLTRVDDILSQKSSSYEQLVKQAKQAERYKTLSETIRRLEALGLAMEWQRITQEIEASQAAMVVANEAQNQAKQSLYELSKQRETYQATWQALELKLQEQQKKIQLVQREKDRAIEELSRYDQTLSDLKAQQEAVAQDQAYDQEIQTTAKQRLEELMQEKADLEARLKQFDSEVQVSEEKKNAARTAYEEAQQTLNQARSKQATLNAQRQMLHQQQQRAQSEQSNLNAERERVNQAIAQLTQEVESINTQDLQRQLQQTETALQATLDHVADLDKQQDATVASAREAVEALQTVQSALHRIDTEMNALARLAEAPNKDQSYEMALSQIKVQTGYEQALSVALGRELRAGLDSSAPLYWQSHAEFVPADLPQYTTPLYSVVQAPAALSAALSMIAIVEDKAAGEALMSQLQVGQMLVSKDGYGWRWDGFTITPQAQASAQERETKQILEQRNRLAALRDERIHVAQQVQEAQNKVDALQTEQNLIRSQITVARQDVTNLQRQVAQERQTLIHQERRHSESVARLQTNHDKNIDITQRLTAMAENLSQLQEALQQLPAEQDSYRELEALQAVAQSAEADYRAADQAFMALHSQQTMSVQRLQSVDREIAENSVRLETSQQRLLALSERVSKIDQALGSLHSPDAAHELMAQSDAKLQDLQKQLDQIIDERNQFNQSRNQMDRDSQAQQEALMSAREALVRSETQFQGAQTMREQLIERSDQVLSCSPEVIAQQFEFTEDDLGQNAQTLRAKQDRMRSERDRIGAVNLRAEEEALQMGSEIEALNTEKEDITAAINKLRHAITTLNRDARKKMLAAFDEVNTRFKEVFTRLFNGGEAYLQLIDAEDPLEAGLEIFAQPPGKRLQALTLLSGGEQSLTATALIFAMFLTQPSPICVLDEIDAALDDANVERISSLLQDFARHHPTRFLVITHNPITMAHLHRLYGVTMVEKGVSKLVSVDLEKGQQQAQMAVAAE